MAKLTKEIMGKFNEEYNTYKTLKEKYEGNKQTEFTPKDTFLIEGNLEEILVFLDDSGFTKLANQSFYDGCNWIYVDLKAKIYVPGKPGINISKVVFDHSITLNEFQSIYNIYQKYKSNYKQGYSLSRIKK